MDTPGEMKDGMKNESYVCMGHGGMMGHCCHGYHRGGMVSRIVRMLVAVFVIVLLFSFVGSLFGMRGWHMGGYGFDRTTNTVGVPGGMMGRWNTDRNAVRVFGVIRKISGSTITILDNGNTERSVLSTPNTVITDSDTELSITDLNVGDRISVTGTSANDILTAQLIEVFAL